MEENTAVDREPETESKPGITEKVRRWIFSDFVQKGLRYSLALSLAIFAFYMAGSIPDLGLPDRVLFLLLRVLRYSSLLSCAFSLFALGASVRRLVYQPSLRSAFGLLVSFFISLLSASLAMLDSFIVAATGGNV